MCGDAMFAPLYKCPAATPPPEGPALWAVRWPAQGQLTELEEAADLSDTLMRLTHELLTPRDRLPSY